MSLAAAHPAQNVRPAKSLREKLGICQWFHFEDYAAVDRTLELLAELGVKHLRTGISWADYHRAGGRAWYDWQMHRLRHSGFEILLSIWHTPPSISEGGVCNSPPKRLRDFADFIDSVITNYGDCFDHMELWNEPNNRYKWDFTSFDPGWKRFAEMIRDAAHWAKHRGCHTVLGGMIPVDPHWLALMRSHGALADIDIIAIHAFPGMWFPHHPNWDWHATWTGWRGKLASIAPHTNGRPIWVTETGLATWDLATNRPAKFELQQQAIQKLATAPGDRFYIYSLIDLDPNRESIEGFHVDENEYHMGLIKYDGTPKPAWSLLRRLLQG
jgi:CDP-paratose 2-epimerase